jgi:uncharacterized protein (TIGR00369 family)
MAAHLVRNPDYESYVRGHFRRVAFTTNIGAQVAHVAPGRCTLTLASRPDLGQQHGYFHGGIVATLADTACGHAGLTLVAADQGLITVEYKINFVAPATGERLEARGEVVQPGRSLFICRSDVYAVHDGNERLCASALASWAVVPGFTDEPPPG